MANVMLSVVDKYDGGTSWHNGPHALRQHNGKIDSEVVPAATRQRSGSVKPPEERTCFRRTNIENDGRVDVVINNVDTNADGFPNESTNGSQW